MSEPMAELLCNMDASYYDEETGDTDGIGWYCIYRGPQDVKAWAAGDSYLVDLVDELSDDDVDDLSTCVGVICKVSTDGSKYAWGYTNADELESAWDDIKVECGDYTADDAEDDEVE